MSDTKLHVRDFLAFVIPALVAAGLPVERVRELTHATAQRMGEGGNTHAWVTTMGEVVAETGDDRATAAFLAAFEAWTAT